MRGVDSRRRICSNGDFRDGDVMILILGVGVGVFRDKWYGRLNFFLRCIRFLYGRVFRVAGVGGRESLFYYRV